MKSRTFAIIFLFIALLGLMSSVGWSQTVQGVITGRVTDPSGVVVPNVQVTVTNTGTNSSQSTTTGDDGYYRFPLIPPGNYIIDIKVAGFAEVKASGIVVEASQVVPFNVKLELAKSNEIVEVMEHTPLVQTATSNLAVEIDRATIENTPLVNRDVFSTLPFLAPQVTPGLNMNPTSGGARESGTSFLLNGADDNDNFGEGGSNIHPPLESVQDFSVLTNSMSAEYGRGFGAVVTANQKSGTNRIHGTVYEYNRNASLNAEDFFSNSEQLPKPKYIRNQYGGEVDGPVYKNKTFFSFAFDRISLLSGSPLTGSTTPSIYVPTSAALANAEANAGPIAKQVLAAFPPITSDKGCPDGNGGILPGTGVGTMANGLPNPIGCASFFDPVTDTSNIYYGRLDHNFSASDRLSFIANVYREGNVDKYGGGGLTTTPINATTANHFHNLALEETHIFNARLLNEATIAHNRHYNTFVEGNGKDTIPEIVIDNEAEGDLGYNFGPAEGGLVQGFVQDRWQLQDNLTWTKGRHNVKFGGGTQIGILYRNWDLGSPGYYEFSELDAANNGAQITPASDGVLQTNGTIANVPAGAPNSNFTNDYPYFMETSINPTTGAKADAYRHYDYHDWYTFVQDDWKFNPRLTLNLGLRWDRYGAPTEDHGILSQFTNIGTCNILSAACIASLRVGPVSSMWHTRNHDFGPRFGFAWDVFGNGKMAVRGGYGIYYDRIFDNVWSNGAWNPPFYALIDSDATAGCSVFYTNPASTGPSYNTSTPFPIPGHRVSLRTMDQNMKDSSGQNYFLGVEHQFLNSFLFRVNYQGSMGRHLPMLENLNRVDGIAYDSSLSPVLPNPLYNGFNYRSNSVTSSYNALVAEVQKRMANGLQFQTGYTYSKLLDVNSELFAGCSTIGSYTAPYYYVTNAQPGMYRGPASFDHRQAFKFNVIYQLPFLREQKGFAGHAFGGWNVSSFFQFYSGHPMDVYNGRSRISAKDAQGNLLLDPNGIPYNIGGDYNLDGVANDHPDFVGGSVSSAYSGNNPADGIFKDNNRIGCGEAGVPSSVDYTVSSGTCPATPNTLFVNPAYGSGTTPYERFGTLGRGVFHGPGFAQMDLGLTKTFRLTELAKLDFRAQAQNVLNHPSFDCVQANLNSGDFGKAQCLAQSVQGIGSPTSRVMSLGLQFSF